MQVWLFLFLSFHQMVAKEKEYFLATDGYILFWSTSYDNWQQIS